MRAKKGQLFLVKQKGFYSLTKWPISVGLLWEMLLDTSACKLQKQPVLVTVNISLKDYVPAITAHVRLLAELISKCLHPSVIYTLKYVFIGLFST